MLQLHSLFVMQLDCHKGQCVWPMLICPIAITEDSVCDLFLLHFESGTEDSVRALLLYVVKFIPMQNTPRYVSRIYLTDDDGWTCISISAPHR